MFDLLPNNVGTFRLYVFGEPGFMEEILLGVAALNGSGFFASAGALGALLGLMITMFQAAGKGGFGLDLGGWFMGVLLYIVMFGPAATLQVNSVQSGGAPAVNVPGIPLGIAVAGNLLTSVGKRVTEATETAFSAVDANSGISKGGPGRTLKWLASIRLLADPDHTSPYLQRLRANVDDYTENCTKLAFIYQPDRGKSAAVSDVLDVVAGFGWDSPAATTRWSDLSSGAMTTVTCQVATANLNAARTSGQLVAEHVALTEPKLSNWRAIDPAGDMSSMMASLGISATNMQRYMFASVVRGVMTRVATQKITGGSSEETSLWAMVAQTSEKKATDFAGQEASFLLVLPSLVTFMEALVFAATPFMAVVMLIGRAGMGAFLKLLFIPAYVMAWFPTMAIINAFSLFSMERTLADIMASTQPGSLVTQWEVTEQALNWLSTSSMLMASTPVIALFLLTGGSFITASVANSLKGGDKTSENIASPDAISNQAATTAQTFSSQHAFTGNSGANLDIPRLQMMGSSVFDKARSVTSTAEAGQQYLAERGNQVSQAMDKVTSNGLHFTSRSGEDVTRAATSAFGTDFTNSKSYSNSNNHERMAAFEWSSAVGASGKAGLTTKDVAHSLDNILQDAAKRGGGSGALMAAIGAARTSPAGRVAGLLLSGISAEGTTASADTERVHASLRNASNLVQDMKAGTRDTTDMAVRATAVRAAAAETLSKQEGSERLSEQDTKTLRAASTEGQKIANAYQETQRQVGSFGSSYAPTMPEAANTISSAAAGGNQDAAGFIAMARELPAPVFNAMWSSGQKFMPAVGSNSDEAAALVGLMVSQGYSRNNSDAWGNSPNPVGAAKEAELGLNGRLLDALSSSGKLSGGASTGSAAAPVNDVGVQNVPTAGTVASQVQAGAPGPDVSRVRSEVGSQQFDSGGFSGTAGRVASKTDDIDHTAPQVGQADRDVVTSASVANRDKVHTPAVPEALSNALGDGFYEALGGRIGDAPGQNLSDVFGSPTATAGPSIGNVARAISQGGMGLPAPSNEATATVMAGAYLANSPIAGLTPGDHAQATEALNSLSPADRQWAQENYNAYAAAGAQSTQTPGVSRPMDSESIAVATSMFRNTPSMIPKLIAAAEQVNPELGNLGRATTSGETFSYQGRQFSTGQITQALTVLNEANRMPEGIQRAVTERMAGDDEE